MLLGLEPFLGVCLRCTAASLLAQLKCIDPLKTIGHTLVCVIAEAYRHIVSLSFSVEDFQNTGFLPFLFWSGELIIYVAALPSTVS